MGVNPLTASGVQVRQQRGAHARIPVVAKVVAHALLALGGGVGREEVADLVGHRNQPLHLDHRGIHARASSGTRLVASSDAGACTRATSTAVTLYSGQFVAQSDKSLVMALALVWAKWKVV
jgi:hypothetical protein